ncbi:putative translation initiation factor eIF-2B subunit beta [Diplogelasinospora grovesii]|uniref:Translation initiation factor eIF2B subunit beta n=1 Tax=Diplogelasinospora grovesii TaxID=303347 RepID=A0AAN6NBQ2_9PEZI|nr:putative translation initiation factor eIF-2B subunit beta [Diplogelasinospora grovesii]
MAPARTIYAPSWEKLEKALKTQPLEASIEALIFLLKRRQLHGDACADATASILRQVVAKSKWHDVDDLLVQVQKAGSRLAQAAPHEPVIGNVVRRVMGLIRDEATESRNADDFGSESASDIQSLAPATNPLVPVPTTRPGPTPIRLPTLASTTSFHVSKSMFNLLSIADPADSVAGSFMTGTSTPISQAQPASVHALRGEVMDGIDEIIDEISQADDQIASFADIQIHPGDFVLVHQPTPTVEKFLVRAAAKRRFTVLISSLSPPQTGEVPYAALRKKLSAAGIRTINLATNGLMAYMPKVNKVIFGARAVYQNGGLLADSGAYTAARAAHESSKPVIVLSGIFKFCPEDPSDEASKHELGNSSSTVSYADGSTVDAIEIENTVAEYVPPNLVDVYLTNL